MSYAMMQARIEELNFERDARNQGPDRLPVLELDDGEVIQLPWKWEVCSVCAGEGKHVNPAIDCGGLSAEDFDEDPEFAEMYFDGAYDVPCNRCEGRRVEREIDWDKVSPEHQALLERQARDEAAYQAEVAMERRMGC